MLVTKPSELSFYPAPKLFIKRVGGHEMWGAIHSAEIGDGTLECRDVSHTLQMEKESILLLRKWYDKIEIREGAKARRIYMNVVEKVKMFISEQGMLNHKDQIVLGLSGGADSVCLFLILQQLAKEYGWGLHCVHVNHGIRGEEAWQDEDFCVKLCRQYQLECQVVHVDVPELARSSGISEEEAGRRVRYEAFEAIAARLEEVQGVDSVKIAVAHHKNDQAETVLHHLCRGTDVTGLAGIRPARGNLIRPMLCLSRREIENFLQKLGQEFQTDSTNCSDEYTRNRLRNRIVPLLEQQINGATVEHICAVAETMAEVDEYLEVEGMAKWDCLASCGEDGIYLEAERLAGLHKVLQRWTIRHAFYALSGTKKDLEKIHIQDVLSLLAKQPGKKVNLPYGIVAIRERNALLLTDAKEIDKDNIYQKLTVDGQWHSVTARMRIMAQLIPVVSARELVGKIPKNDYTKWFDYDKIENAVFLRTLVKEDSLIYDTQGHHKNFKKLCVDEGISARDRKILWGITEGDSILWIPRVRSSAGYFITEQTKRILEIRIEER